MVTWREKDDGRVDILAGATRCLLLHVTDGAPFETREGGASEPHASSTNHTFSHWALISYRMRSLAASLAVDSTAAVTALQQGVARTAKLRRPCARDDEM